MAAGLINASQLSSEGSSNNDEIMDVEEPAKEKCDVCGIQTASQLLLYGAQWILLRGIAARITTELLNKSIV